MIPLAERRDNMNLKNILIILIVLWCGVIFYASSRNNIQSNGKSRRIIYVTAKTTARVTNKLKITKIDLSNDIWANNIVKKYNGKFRKCCHATVYFILSILIMICLRIFKINPTKALLIAIGVCFLYSLTDEFHQLFVSGRSGEFRDCMIDTLGATIGAIISRIIFLFL